MVPPKFRPGLARRPANKNVWMRTTLLVLNAFCVPIVSCQTARREGLLHIRLVVPNNNQRRGRWDWVSAQPSRIGPADGRRKTIHWPKDFNRSLFAIIPHNDADVFPLLRRQ